MRVAVDAKRFGSRRVLSEVRFDLGSGRVLAITGPSGCGKTTLLRIIAGLDRDFDGVVDVPEPVGMVFQEPRLFPWRTIAQNVALALPETTGDAGARQAAREALTAVGLVAEADNFPRAMSLGMARRVAIARALAIGPALMLLDEPFVSLDEATASQIRNLLHRLWQAQEMSVIMVTHNLDEALDLADRIIVLDGTPATIIDDRLLDLARDLRTSEWRREQAADLRAPAIAELMG